MSTVTVLCKKPYGVELQVGNQKVVLNGYNSSAVAHGYGITENVPKELWDAWVEQHKGHKLYTLKKMLMQVKAYNHGKSRIRPCPL